jgi:hypothetical protein
MNTTIESIVAQYTTDKTGIATLTRHGNAVATATAKMLAAGGTWTEAIQSQANALLESKVFGDDEAKARKDVAVFVTACAKAAGAESGIISKALNAAEFRTRAPRANTTKATKATPAEAIAKYLSGHTAADIKKALKTLGYTVAKA